MQLIKVFSIAISLLMSATGLKAETPSIEELSDGITAFLCEDDKGINHDDSIHLNAFFESNLRQIV